MPAKEEIQRLFERTRGGLPTGARWWLTKSGEAQCLRRNQAELRRVLKTLDRNIARRRCKK